MGFLQDNLPIVIVAALVVAALLFLLLRPRQRVQLSKDAAPVRPHMAAGPRREGRDVISEAAAAASDVSGDIITARVHDHLPGASGPPDDLERLKGVGPKFASMLNERGITRYEQLATLSDGEVERLDQSLGAFRGRLQRDRIQLQAGYLARGDVDGFEQTFGKL